MKLSDLVLTFEVPTFSNSFTFLSTFRLPTSSIKVLGTFFKFSIFRPLKDYDLDSARLFSMQELLVAKSSS